MKTAILFTILLTFCLQVCAQEPSITRMPSDTSGMKINMDAIYDRPFLQYGKTPVALGGYLEANTLYEQSNGITEGLSFQARRLTMFMSSVITRNIRFLTEIEFEDGTKEINIEFAAVDIEFHPMLNLRGGIIMNPIGAFNQNHDGPKWEFIERPISSTQLIPSTWSNAGFGVHGKNYHGNWVFAYEAYVSGGFDDQIISNEENKTFLPASKLNRERFEESNNGIPLTTEKIAIRHKKVGELGLSHMGGVYNKFREDGIVFDSKRRVDVFAVDFNTHLNTSTAITTEWCMVWIDIPSSYSQQFGKRQVGGFIDVVQPIVRRKLFGFERSVLNVACRLDYADWNVDTFRETGGNISDDIFAITPAISWRPAAQTVIRLNYRYQWQTDLLGNRPEKTAAVLFGISSYF